MSGEAHLGEFFIVRVLHMSLPVGLAGARHTTLTHSANIERALAMHAGDVLAYVALFRLCVGAVRAGVDRLSGRILTHQRRIELVLRNTHQQLRIHVGNEVT